MNEFLHHKGAILKQERESVLEWKSDGRVEWHINNFLDSFMVE